MQKQVALLVTAFCLLSAQQSFAQVWNPAVLGEKSLTVEKCRLRATKGVMVQTFWGLVPSYGVSTFSSFTTAQDGRLMAQFEGFRVSVQVASNLGQGHLDLVNFSQKVKPTFRASVWNTQGKMLKAADGFINYANEYIPNEYMARNSGVVNGGKVNNKNQLEFVNKEQRTAVLLQVECDLQAQDIR